MESIQKLIIMIEYLENSMMIRKKNNFKKVEQLRKKNMGKMLNKNYLLPMYIENL